MFCPRDDISGAYHSVDTALSCNISISTAIEKQTLFWKRTVQEVSHQSVPSYEGLPPPRQVVCRGSLLLLEQVNEWLPSSIVGESGWVQPKSVEINPCEDLEAIASREGLVLTQSPPKGDSLVLMKPSPKRVQLSSLDGGSVLDLPMIGEVRDIKESRERHKRKKVSNLPTKALELPPPMSSIKGEGKMDTHSRKKNPIKIIVSGLFSGLKRLIRFLIPIPQKEKVHVVVEDKKVLLKRNSETVKAPLDWSEDVSSPFSLSLTQSQKSLISTLNQKFMARVSRDGNLQPFEKRMEGVRWGGPSTSTKTASFSWYFPPASSKSWGVDKEESGTRSMTALLKIVKWPSNLISNFPFNLCKDNCPVEVALTHTVEFREKFQPWKMTDAAYRENQLGWMYVRGYSPTRYHENASKGGYSLLWYRPGKKKIDAYEPYIRVVINSLDRCVADSLSRSDGYVGKCNVILDCDGFGMMMIPPMKFVKKILPMMQDHFPDRMGVLILVNLAGAAQIFMGIVTPFLPDAVKKKIHVLPNDEEAKEKMLKELVDEQFVPTWLGGKDGYLFNAAEYYKGGAFETEFFSDEEGIEYARTMPYHA